MAGQRRTRRPYPVWEVSAFCLGFLFVKFTMYNPLVAPFHLDSVMLAFSLLIVPVFDVVRVSLARIYHRKPIFHADTIIRNNIK